jgi:excisionase family DNA binding protein
MTNEIVSKEFLSIKELCTRWGVSSGLIRREQANGNLVGVQFGKLWRFSCAEVLRYERERLGQPPVKASKPRATAQPAPQVKRPPLPVAKKKGA